MIINDRPVVMRRPRARLLLSNGIDLLNIPQLTAYPCPYIKTPYWRKYVEISNSQKVSLLCPDRLTEPIAIQQGSQHHL